MKPLFLVTLVIAIGCSRSTPTAQPPAAATTGTVTIEIVGETENQQIEIADVAAGTTLEDVMRSVTDVPVKMSGSGTTAFVEAIGERAINSTAGWTFTVDGEFANQGIGNTTLAPPTTVTWSFGDFSSP